MVIGIDASRAFIKNRTGIEEYSYQVIKHLVGKLESHQVILYVRKANNLQPTTNNQIGNFKLPDDWKIKVIKWPYLWTQLGLSLEILFHPVDILFVPAHTVPVIHPKNTIVTIHGLEYEFCPRAYSFWERLYMRWSIRNSCRWAKKIIAVSENTKKDLMKLYKVPESKISVIYEGYDNQVQSSKFKVQSEDLSFRAEQSGVEESNLNKDIFRSLGFARDDIIKYLFFIGRLEERKNIIGIIKAFKILKKKYKVPHKLILAGKFGYGEDKIKNYISNSSYRSEVITPGYIGDEKKWELLKNADIFLFPTFYEGFGLPILEAQSVGVPVVAGDNSSIREVVKINCHSERSEPVSEVEESNHKIRSLGYARDDRLSAILVNPHNPEQIADAAYKLISDKALRNDIIQRGYKNVKRFSWELCVERISQTLMEANIDTKFNKK